MRKRTKLVAIAAAVTMTLCASSCSDVYRFFASLSPSSSTCEHNYADWRVVKDATCAEDGLRKRSCVDCADEQSEVVDRVAHVYGERDVSGSCTERSAIQRCINCDDEQTISLQPIGHTFDHGVCADCGVSVDEADLSYLDAYNATFSYDHFATLEKGESLQALYNAIDKDARRFHVDPDLRGEDVGFDGYKGVTMANYAKLGLTTDEAFTVWQSYKSDHPLYYWISTTLYYDEEILYLLTEDEYANGAIRSEYNTLVHDKLEEYYLRSYTPDDSYATLLGYHDEILYAVDYTYDENGFPSQAPWAHNVLGVFNEQGAVCESFAKTYQLLLNYSDIENRIVFGRLANGEVHSWNMARMNDGNWYWFDLTTDDAPTWKWGIRHNHFCVNDTENTMHDELGEVYPPETFLDSHAPFTPDGKSFEWQAPLPERSKTPYAAPALRKQFSAGNLTYSVVGSNAVELLSATGVGPHLTVPQTVDHDGVRYDVIALNDGFFNASSHLYETITLPKTLRFISDNSLRFPSLKNIYVDGDNEYFTSKDGVLFTKSLYTLISYPDANERTEYEIPNETREIAAYAFNYCSHLHTLTVGKNVEYVGTLSWGTPYLDAAPIAYYIHNLNTEGWLRLYNSLRGEKTLRLHPENAHFTVVDGVVYDTAKRELFLIMDPQTRASFTLLSTVTTIFPPARLLQGLSNLEQLTVEAGNEVFYSVGNCLVERKTNTLVFGCKNSVLPADGTIAVIGSEAFMDCAGLTQLTLPNGVTAIEMYAFSGCSDLKSISLPSSLKSIGSSAFMNCLALRDIYYAGTKAEWSSVAKEELHVGSDNYTVHCSDGDVKKS